MSTSDEIRVQVNGETRQVRARNLADLLAELGHEDTRGLAVALGDQVVPRSMWTESTIDGSERIEIVTAVQGG